MPARRPEQPGAIERFYQLLLLLLDHPARAPALIDDALPLIAEITNADSAYVEIFGAEDQPTLARGYPHNSVVGSVARDLVNQTVAERRTLAVSARAGNGLVARLCVPIRAGSVVGIVWLERKQRSFSELERDRARMLAKRIAAVGVHSPRTLGEERRALDDRHVEEALVRCNGNIAKAARELGVSRAFIYAVRKRRRDLR